MTHETHGEEQVLHDTEEVRCAIYARSATANPGAIEAQIKACREATGTKGWVVLDDYVEVDEGESGKKVKKTGSAEASGSGKNQPTSV